MSSESLNGILLFQRYLCTLFFLNIKEQIIIVSTNISPLKVASRNCSCRARVLVIEKVAVFGYLFTLI